MTAEPFIPAATLILMRERAHGPELLFMERTARMAFAPEALVFPGGRIEADDHLLAARFAPGDALGAARIAAIRETVEEIGIAVAFVPEPEVQALCGMREALKHGGAFSALMAQMGLGLQLPRLTHFGNWRPSLHQVRRFDTHFFLCAADADEAALAPDSDEAKRIFWARPADILAEAEEGRAKLLFPTRINLERLATFHSIDAALADVARHPVRLVEPWLEERDGNRRLCIPENIGYPVTSLPVRDERP